MLTLYFSPGSSSMAPHIALHEIACPFEAKPVSFAQKEQRSEAFLALNPEGKVPTLLIDGRPLTEVAAILFYLARRHPEAGLLPEDVEAQAHVVSWMSFIAATLHPARRQGLDHAREIYALADRKLGGAEWAVGAYSIADIHLFRLFWRFRGSFDPRRRRYAESASPFRAHDAEACGAEDLRGPRLRSATRCRRSAGAQTGLAQRSVWPIRPDALL